MITCGRYKSVYIKTRVHCHTYMRAPLPFVYRLFCLQMLSNFPKASECFELSLIFLLFLSKYGIIQVFYDTPFEGASPPLSARCSGTVLLSTQFQVERTSHRCIFEMEKRAFLTFAPCHSSKLRRYRNSLGHLPHVE